MLRNCVYNTSLYSAMSSSMNTIVHSNGGNEFKHYHPIKLSLRRGNKKGKECKKALSMSAFVRRPLKMQVEVPKVEVNKRKCALMMLGSTCNIKNYKIKNVNDVTYSFMKQTKQAIISRNNNELNEYSSIHTTHNNNNNSSNNTINNEHRYKLLKGNNAEIFTYNYFNKHSNSSRDVKDIITNEICNKSLSSSSSSSHNRSAFINRFLRKQPHPPHSNPKPSKHSSSLHIERTPWLYINRKINVINLLKDTTCMSALLNNVYKTININNKSFI